MTTTEIPWSVLKLRKSMILTLDGDRTFAGTIRLWLQLNTLEIDTSGTRSGAQCVHALHNFADDALTPDCIYEMFNEQDMDLVLSQNHTQEHPRAFYNPQGILSDTLSKDMMDSSSS
ncbi:hypothetical protein LZL87_009388 [Fusarium oxysporum]|nr:hypothetical protein LZL87_009388 [Fusarium oxysporum]